MAKINYYLKKPVESLVWSFCKWRVKAIAEKYFKIETFGLDNLPAESAILVPNHEIGIDAGLLGVAIPRRIHYLVQNEGVYDSRNTMLLWAMGQIPVNVDKRSSNKQVIKRAGDYLSYSKDLIGIFGEGPSMNLNVAGGTLPLAERRYQLGAAHFAISKSKKIIPVALVTLNEIAQQFWSFPWDQQERKLGELAEYVRLKGRIPYRVCVGGLLEGSNKLELTARVKDEICRMYNESKKSLEHSS